ncbi:strubbelig-receptor family [Musa troglodytarum]|uniref:Strubbelig-receptor family n=1 Tax=Musa troglodytarum TaxID=320322 RepID=A0A9E7GTE4_9LILI|nr:strubbelig-receptor family [Musa troglodytarum]
MVLPTSTSTTSSFSSSSSFDPLLETVIIGGANVSQRNHRGFASRSIGTLVPPPLAPFTPRLHGRIAQALDSCLPRWLDISRECYLSLLFLRLSDLVRGNTDQSDVSALNVMYSSLNSPSQLTDEAFDTLSGLQLTGTMGYQLSSLISVTDFDLSKNNLNDDIPYQLPPNTTHVNLAGNALTGGIPYSVSQMTHLKYLNLASNQLSGQLTDMFGELSSLSLLDLSFNCFSGNLPNSFGSLSSLKTLNLQNNQLSGSVDVLATLSLENLVGGNSWSSGKPPPGMVTATDNNGKSSIKDAKDNKVKKGKQHSGLKGAVIAVILITVLVVGLILLALVKRRSSGSSHYTDERLIHSRSFRPLVDNEFTELKDSSSSIDIKALETSSMELKPPAADTQKSYNDNEFADKLNSTGSTDPVSLTIYALADLQAATGSFSSSCLLGQGNIGCVYKAKFNDGKMGWTNAYYCSLCKGNASQRS